MATKNPFGAYPPMTPVKGAPGKKPAKGAPKSPFKPFPKKGK